MDIVKIEGEEFFKIANSDQMRPFFMSIVSDSNHWMFISSNGGLSAGRKNSDFALFPYYTDDKITEMADTTGSKSIFRISNNGSTTIWEPFSERFNDKFKLTRNLYKNLYGNKIIFEEVLHDFDLTFRYQWNSSNQFGFVKKSQIINNSAADYNISMVDGIQNIMPHGVSSDLQAASSNLVDAYKRSELHQASGLGIFALSAIIVDKAEPSEALKANIAWCIGLDKPVHLLSSLQLPAFRKNQKIRPESDVKGERGAYFVSVDFTLSKGGGEKNWKIVANVNQNQSQVVALSESISKDATLDQRLEQDIELGKQDLIAISASADGLQYTADKRNDTRHFANVLFNLMRGGVFDENYVIEKGDFLKYIEKANNHVFKSNQQFLTNLKETFSYSELLLSIMSAADADLVRLCTEYLPLKFSRRHGDPSRPWNKFSINTRSEVDGSKVLDYQGNWRDIFQNWEALAQAFPEFMEGMIFKFLNASTFDGYNPYRVTKDGFDWEKIEPEDPWSYIGYWGDHQIIYLLKFLEFIEKYKPGKLAELFENETFVYAGVPYNIKSYEQILANSKDTVDYNHHLEKTIELRKKQLGSDGALLFKGDESIYHVNFVEKILATVLAKLSNFIPEGGIWMNTQRPEWNDANNALVGNGVSMVTLYYLRRFLTFFYQTIEKSAVQQIKISAELIQFYEIVSRCFAENQHLLKGKIDNKTRKAILDQIGQAASDYRIQIYQSGFSGAKSALKMTDLQGFAHNCLAFIDHSIKANQRKDKLYHSYNLMSIEKDGVAVSHLAEMLEGQVAILGSGALDGQEALEVLDALRNSKLYRTDQNSYILYPNKDLPKFLEKNVISKVSVEHSELLKKLVADGNAQIVERDILGDYHFNGNFHNVNVLKSALNSLSKNQTYSALVKAEFENVCGIFEEVFNHKAFTGRSGTFFAYEGLGSIYWHMVSKLHLAAQEACFKSIQKGDSQDTQQKLVNHYREIGAGIGLHKSPNLYGAFPTDPYSHTPAHKGAQQPGMTGQVKEDVLIRNGEFGINYTDGKLQFDPSILSEKEFFKNNREAKFINIKGEEIIINIEKSSIAFSICQVPVVYTIGSETQLVIHYQSGKSEAQSTLLLNENLSAKIFQRTGDITQINITIPNSSLKF